MPNSIEIWLAPAFAMARGNDQRIASKLAPLVEFHESRVLRGLATHARAGHNRGFFAKRRRKRDSRISQSFAGCNDQELRKRVQQAYAVGLKVVAGVVSADLGTVPKP